jgi:hypothetical protein
MERKIRRYTIVAENTLSELVLEVNNLLSDWEPFGPLVVTPKHYCQAMISYKP